MFEQNDNLEKEIQKVRMAKWLLTHRAKFKRLLTAILISINLIIWGIVIYQFIIFIQQSKSHQETMIGLTKNLIDYQSYHQRVKPLDLIISNQSVIFLGQTEDGIYRYDCVAEIENPNAQWVVTSFDYQFIWDNGSTEKKSSFIFPNEKKYIFSSVQTKNRIISAELKIDHLSYLRKRPEMDSKFQILNDLIFENIELIPSFISDTKIIPARLRIKASNQTAYSFWQVDAISALYRGEKIVYIIRTPIKEWLSGEVRNLEINLFSLRENITKIKVIPEVNILDSNVLML